MSCDVCSLCRRHVSPAAMDHIDVPGGSLPAHVSCLALEDDLAANDVDPSVVAPLPWESVYEPEFDAFVASLRVEARQ